MMIQLVWINIKIKSGKIIKTQKPIIKSRLERASVYYSTEPISTSFHED